MNARSDGSRRARRVVPLAIAALLASGCAAGQVAETSDQKTSLDGVNVTKRHMDLRAVAVESPPIGLAAYPAGTDAELKLVLVNQSTATDTLTSIRTSAATTWANFADYNNAFQVQQSKLDEATGSSSPSASPSATDTAPVPSSDSASPGDGSQTSSGNGNGNGRRNRSSASSSSPEASPSAEPLPKGVRSVVIAPGARISFGTPDATGAILLMGLTSRLYPGTTIRITFTFREAGTVTVSVPVQLGEVPRGPEIGGGSDDEGE